MENCTTVDIDKPACYLSTYTGRMKHFFSITNPFNLLRPDSQLDEAKRIVDMCRSGVIKAGLTMNDVYKAKQIVDSAFHPETGEKMFLLGRMSAQVPMNMVIIGCMLSFNKSAAAVIFWQWFNQSFNALVNYTNRSGSSDIPTEKLLQAYVCATGGAVITALTLNKLAKRAPPILGRFVPFFAIAAANCINIPMMRYKELDEGIDVWDEHNYDLGKSKMAAIYAIVTVILSRIAMAIPGMVFAPLIMAPIEKTKFFQRNNWIATPLQILIVGIIFTFSTPMSCALFPQTYPISIDKLEDRIQANVSRLVPAPSIAYYNKGL